MLDNLNILKLASAMARHAADRHGVLSQNIANADTNNFKAKDLEPFSQAYERFIDKNGTIKNELNAVGNATPWRVDEINTPGVATPNGNNVSLEDQMLRTIEAQQHHETATLIYKKSLDILRMSLGRGA